MNRDIANTYAFLFDLILTAADYLARKLGEARQANLITADEQAQRIHRIEQIRARVGLE